MKGDVPPAVRRRALACGASHWLRTLPERIEDLEGAWSITVGVPFAGGTEAYVAEAVTSDGMPVVLKLTVPHENAAVADEIKVLSLARGEGCVELLRHDVEQGAMLLERLGPSLSDLGVPVADTHSILADVARRLWRSAPGCGLLSGADKAKALSEADPLELIADPDPRTRARMLARRTGLDAEAIWQWGVVERVSTGLVATRSGLQPIGRQLMDVADRLADNERSR